MSFETLRSAADRELDESLQTALAGRDFDVSNVLSRVRQEMQPAARPRRYVMWSGIAAAFFLLAVAAATLIDVASRGRAIAVEAACDHYEELMRPSAKRWRTQAADVSTFLNERFPNARDLTATLTPAGASFEKVGTCRLEGVRYAHLVYRRGAQQISVLVRMNEPLEQSVPRFDYHDDAFGLQLASFNTRQYTGIVITTLASGATRSISDSIASRLP